MLRIGILLLLLIFVPGCISPVRIDIPVKEPKPLHLNKRPRVALVLGGGAARGFAHIGVIKVLAKEKIPVDLIVGTSSGSIIGALYADNGDAAAVEKAMRGMQFFDVADISASPFGLGLISGRKFQHFLVSRLDCEWFDELKIPMVAVATNLYTGEPKILSSGPIVPAINASCSLPGVMHPVDLYGYRLIDGGIVAQVPVNIAKRYHPIIIISVNIENDLSDELPISPLSVFERAFDISIHALADYTGRGADIAIHPEVGTASGIGLDPEQQDALILAGENAAKRAIPNIKKLLRKHHQLISELYH